MKKNLLFVVLALLSYSYANAQQAPNKADSLLIKKYGVDTTKNNTGGKKPPAKQNPNNGTAPKQQGVPKEPRKRQY